MSDPTTTKPDAPVDARIDALDVLRGVAVAGILLADVLVVFGSIFRPPDVGVSLPGAWLGGPARVAHGVCVKGKFLTAKGFPTHRHPASDPRIDSSAAEQPATPSLTVPF